MVASVEKEPVEKSRPEPESYADSVTTCVLIIRRCVDQEVAVVREGEGSWGGAGEPVKSRRTLAQVAVGLRLVGGDTQSPVLAVVGVAPRELHRAVLPTPGYAVWVEDATADIVSDGVFAGPSIFTRVALAFIYLGGTLDP